MLLLNQLILKTNKYLQISEILKNTLKNNLHLILLILGLISCKKDGIEQKPVLPINEQPQFFIIPYDTLIQTGPQSSKEIKLDLNNDSIMDIQVSSDDFGMAGTGHVPGSLIHCLNNDIMLSIHVRNDSAFYSTDLHKDTINGQIWMRYLYTNYTNNYKSGDILQSVTPNVNHLKYFNESDTISVNDDFAKGTFVMSESSYYTPTRSNLKNDTVWIYQSLEDKSFGTIPNDSIIYIGLKIKTKDGLRLGWIKLSVSEQYIIHLYETALQFKEDSILIFKR